MTGPEHFLKAERLLADADSYEDDRALELARDRRAEAQVHALLALAAATAMAAPVESDPAGFTVEEHRAWFKVSGTRPGGASDGR
jgi:hypothetical protein